MANVLIEEGSLQDSADAIREMSGSTGKFKAAQFGDAIRGLRVRDGGATDLDGVIFGDGSTVSAVDQSEAAEGQVLKMGSDGVPYWGEGGGGSSVVLKKIYIQTPPTKTAYKAGETFDPTGMVVLADYYIDNVPFREGIEVTGYTYPTGALTVDINSVQISYSEGGVTATAAQAIGVTKTDLTVPTLSGTYIYDGTDQTPVLNNDPGDLVTKSGDTSGKNAGSYNLILTINDTNLYQWANGVSNPVTIPYTIGAKEPTLTASPSSVTLDADNLTKTSTITCDGDGTLSVESSDTSIATASISGKTVTISHVNQTSGNTTIMVKHTAKSCGNYATKEIEIAVEASFSKTYGASWDGSSTTKWTRTDAAAGFADPVPYVAGAANYGSPFDDISPWKDMTVVDDSAAGKLVKIPKFYYKLTANGSGLSVQISMNKEDGFSVSPMHMNRGDGKGERDVAYVGRYHCATSTYKSTSGVNPANNATRSAMRTSIHNLGSTIWQFDFAARFTLWLLYIVEFADWNSQTKIGYGCGNNSGVQTMGYTDSMPYHTGTTQSSRTTYGLGTQYRNIEGLWDNVMDWFDGCYYNSNGMNIILNPANFSDTANGTLVGKPSNGWPGAFTVSNAAGFPMFYASATGGSESTYSCDSWYFNASGPCVCGGGYYSQDAGHGLFYVSCSSASSTSAYLGSRLQKLP